MHAQERGGRHDKQTIRTTDWHRRGEVFEREDKLSLRLGGSLGTLGIYRGRWGEDTTKKVERRGRDQKSAVVAADPSRRFAHLVVEAKSDTLSDRRLGADPAPLEIHAGYVAEVLLL